MVWKLNKIGRPMMCGDPFNLDFAELIKAIEDNSKMPNMLVQYYYCTLGFIKILLYIIVNKLFCNFAINTFA
jgi:hypothetical protein